MTDPSQTLVEERETFVQIPDWVLLHPQLSAPAVRLYGVLKRYARMSERAWPGRKALAGHLGCSEDSVDRYVKQLRDVGAVDVTHRWITAPGYGETGQIVLEPGPGRIHTSSIYRLRWHEPAVANGSGLAAARVQGGGRKDAGTGGRKDAGTVAAPVRHEVHAPEAHPEGSTSSRAGAESPDLPRADEKLNDDGTSYAAGTSPSARVSLAHLASKIHAENADRLAVDSRGVEQVIRQAWTNGVPGQRIKSAVRMLLRDGQKLAPWTLQEYVGKAAAASSTGVAGW